ncbi:aromatic ring-hydroxylating dioxygenase subunit alpha [Sphingobium sp. AS12]|uniref:aromatic ring-hydroxylating dioxygenase subunit alpha n=1 Tax=Sphingobium sp. AS12 TaxID=2849495 RepID=UPI001C31D022|nr:aromatic ring-hydroxylating dioxygenase subunit alpha [Sphingobium sp. AS12]MBV2148097.1 aromatic ring-hydroxylating dioxygenase subunit alpha [Sphingobium sp. AS12]
MFLKNVWYVAGPAEEFGDAVISRRICNELIALYRKQNGTLVALEDRCPHRFVPLSMGRREVDDLRCGYHGLKFGPDGQCSERPGGTGENPAPICVKSYPVAECHGYAWLWMGDPAHADTALIPDFSFITDPAFKCEAGYLHVKGHHELVTDNLLDLSHVNYLHPQIASTSHWAEWDNQVEVTRNTVWSRLRRPNQIPGAFQKMMWGSDSERGDGRGDVRWDAPSVLYANTAITEVGADIETTGLHTPSAHLLTPETDRSTHYFWVTGRNKRKDDAELTAALEKGVGTIFSTQDGPMVEAEQAAMGDSTDFLGHKPLILKADAAGIRARRILRRMIREEQEANGSANNITVEPAE